MPGPTRTLQRKPGLQSGRVDLVAGRIGESVAVVGLRNPAVTIIISNTILLLFVYSLSPRAMLDP